MRELINDLALYEDETDKKIAAFHYYSKACQGCGVFGRRRPSSLWVFWRSLRTR
jgi:hypothetical protein